MGRNIEREVVPRGQREHDLRVDRLEALTNIAYLLRNDMESRERTEVYLQLMDGVLAGMVKDELDWPTKVRKPAGHGR